MGFEPVGAYAAGDFEGDAAAVGFGHVGGDYLLEAWELVGDYVEYEFVVDLHYHARAESGFLDVAVDINHGQLDDVGSRPLQGSVDGIALGIATHHRVARIDVGQVAFAPHEGGDESAVFGALYLLVDVFAYVRITGEIAVDELLGLRARYA